MALATSWRLTQIQMSQHLDSQSPLQEILFRNLADNASCTAASGVLGGIAFNDSNLDGVNISEPGLEDVIAVVYDCDGLEIARDTTNNIGAWEVTGLDDGQQYRIEFSAELLVDMVPSWQGTDNGSTVQFSAPNSCGVNVGFANSFNCDLLLSTPLGDPGPDGKLLLPKSGPITCGVPNNAGLPANEEYVLAIADWRFASSANPRPVDNTMERTLASPLLGYR